MRARQISPEVPRTSLMGKVTGSGSFVTVLCHFQYEHQLPLMLMASGENSNGVLYHLLLGVVEQYILVGADLLEARILLFGHHLQRLLEKHNNSSGLEPESLVSGILARYTYYGHEVHIQNIFEACGEDGSFIEVFTREFLPRNIHGTPIQKAFSPGIFLTKVSISVYFPLKVLGAFLVALRGMSARVPLALEVGMGTAVWYRLGIAYIWLKAGLTNPGSSDSITQHYCQITIANF
ncbi:hypothetical protein D9757_012808 [Collybiopsis confluens]|uniref:Uncharacterized protein n=1 Tax=Collybiopsis confluens TaxID=2823264 RepID=A0A8H5GIR1_9AGAR|nr:hypothetical protein D9757_012808 [Collybiopsis confluens]